MQKYIVAYLGLACWVMFYSVTVYAMEAGWEEVKNQHGVSVYSRHNESGYIEIKAHTRIDAKVSQFMALLENVALADQWIDGCEKVELLSAPNDSERIVHSYFSAPWPFKDRDMVTHSITQTNQETGNTIIDIKDLGKRYPSVDNYVRMENVSGRWTINNTRNQQIEITYQGFGEPAGKLPVWLANQIIVRSTFNTFTGLQEQLAKSPD